MPAKGKRNHCIYGHDWRVSFDGRFYYCYYCQAQWRGDIGQTDQTPPQDSYRPWATFPKQQFYPNSQEYTYTQEHKNTGDYTEMANTEAADSILSKAPPQGNTSGSGEPEAEWKSVEDILYQPIVVTRANLADKYDEYSGKNKTYAYVNFYFAEDETQAPYVFRTAWNGVRGKIKALLALKAAARREQRPENDPFPLECGVAEIVIEDPMIGDDGTVRYPLNLLPFEQLQAAHDAMMGALAAQGSTDYSLSANQEPDTPASPPVRPAARAASDAPGHSTAATAGKGSANRPLPNNLRNRGN